MSRHLLTNHFRESDFYPWDAAYYGIEQNQRSYFFNRASIVVMRNTLESSLITI